MQKSVRWLSIALVLSLVLGIAAVQPALAQPKAKDIRFVIVGGAEGAPEASAEAMAINMYIGALDYRLRTYQPVKGKYNLKYVSTLFNDANDCLTGVSSGAAEMTFSGPHYLEQLEPSWKVGEAPGVFDSFEHFMKAMDTPAWKAVQEKTAKEKGVTILKWMMSAGDFYLFTKKGPVKSMADLKDQKIRYPGGEGFSRSLKAMGTTPVSLPYTEVVSALQTNMIDGLVTDIFGAMFFFELPRYTKYMIPVTWATQPVCMVVNTQFWNSLPEADRKVIKEAFDRIETAPYFTNTQAGLNMMWAKGPNTEASQLEKAEIDKWKKLMRDNSAELIKGVDPKLIEAIQAVR
jgi:TRAP-type C4-dicarboxylate transport system substrate-binding protein